MGTVRTTPQKNIQTLTETHDQLYFITTSVCGWQYYMSDFQVSITSGRNKLFVVIDGHQGPQVAQLCHEQLPHMYTNNSLIGMGQYLSGVENIISQLDNLIIKSHKEINQYRLKHKLPQLGEDDHTRAGCSLCLVLFTQEEIIIGTVGECRCYVCYEKDPSKVVLFSGNHTTSNVDEEARVCGAGGYVLNGRVNGMYPFTRSVGHLHLKTSGLLTSEPTTFSLRKDDICRVILGSSGVWERPDYVVKNVMQLGTNVHADRQIMEDLLESLIAKESNEGSKLIGFKNMTLTAICLNK